MSPGQNVDYTEINSQVSPKYRRWMYSLEREMRKVYYNVCVLVIDCY